MSVLEEAQALVYGDRQGSYGHPRDNFAHTAGMLNAYLSHKLSAPLTAEDVAAIMICVKLSRLKHAYKRDSVVDIAGYAATWERVAEE